MREYYIYPHSSTKNLVQQKMYIKFFINYKYPLHNIIPLTN